MNHPQDEQWMSYLYDELTTEEKAPLQIHLQSCPECQTKVNAWQTTRASLDAWQVTAQRLPRKQSVFTAPILRWAAAAAILLFAGAAIGRLTSAAVSEDRVRAEIEPRLRREFARMLHEELNQMAVTTLQASGQQTKDLLASYAATTETNRETDNAAILNALNRISAQHIADYLSLKKDVDTVAVNTDLGFRSTQRELNQLTDYPLTGNNVNSQPKN